MKLLPLLVLLNCVPTGIYHQAREYPNIPLVLRSGASDEDQDGIIDSYYYGFDLDGNLETVEVYAIYWIQSIEGGKIIINLRPYQFVWVRRGVIVGRQFDEDMDGRIDAITGEPEDIKEQLLEAGSA